MPAKGPKLPLPNDDVVFPDKAVIDLQVASIVDLGLRHRPRFFPFLRNMYQEVGFRYIFRDRTEILFVSVVCLLFAALWALGAGKTHHVEGVAYSVIFTISPLLYLILAVMSFAEKRLQETYEVEMTCKYNVYQLAAFRMLLFSCIAIAVNAMSIGVMTVICDTISPVRALMISLTSLFLFSGVFLYALTKVNSERATYGVSAGWIVMNVLMLEFGGALYHRLLEAMPWYGYAAVMLLGVLWYWTGLKNLMFIRHSEGGFAFAYRSKRD